MPIARTICLTDGEIVLNWIQRENRDYKQFIQNRVLEIRRYTPIESRHHVQGTENIADLPSRGCYPRHLNVEKLNNRWIWS